MAKPDESVERKCELSGRAAEMGRMVSCMQPSRRTCINEIDELITHPEDMFLKLPGSAKHDVSLVAGMKFV